MINLLQQSNLWNNHYRTSKSRDWEALLLQLRVVILQLFDGIEPIVLHPLCLVHCPVRPTTHLLQDLVVVAHVVHPHHRSAPLIFSLLIHTSHQLYLLTNISNNIQTKSRPGPFYCAHSPILNSLRFGCLLESAPSPFLLSLVKLSRSPLWALFSRLE